MSSKLHRRRLTETERLWRRDPEFRETQLVTDASKTNHDRTLIWLLLIGAVLFIVLVLLTDFSNTPSTPGPAFPPK